MLLIPSWRSVMRAGQDLPLIVFCWTSWFIQESVGATRCLFSHAKKNQSIVINDSITITIVDIRGDKVRLGIDAPKEVAVHRHEIYEAIKQAGFGEIEIVETPDQLPMTGTWFDRSGLLTIRSIRLTLDIFIVFHCLQRHRLEVGSQESSKKRFIFDRLTCNWPRDE